MSATFATTMIFDLLRFTLKFKESPSQGSDYQKEKKSLDSAAIIDWVHILKNQVISVIKTSSAME